MKKTEISVFTEDIDIEIEHIGKFREWIKKAIEEENKYPGEINFIYCDDKYLLEINKEYLSHDYYTDIVTFDNSEEDKEISGDIFISFERIKENSEKFNESIDCELSRVSIHGILHLVGYNDCNVVEKAEMRKMEDYYLSKKIFKIVK